MLKFLTLFIITFLASAIGVMLGEYLYSRASGRNACCGHAIKMNEKEIGRQVAEVLARRWEAQMLAREKLAEFLSGYSENDIETESEAKA